MRANFVYRSTFAIFCQKQKIASLGYKNMRANFVYRSTFAIFAKISSTLYEVTDTDWLCLYEKKF